MSSSFTHAYSKGASFIYPITGAEMNHFFPVIGMSGFIPETAQ